ncbi:uncharacterized protein ldlrad2 isoform X2 [Brienomyrus brachyistius]|uniref:uncharacterized protein ldlrad2 isoform X2 n=1 Tax=Brienomyrus brachyistius TaxID=42636 RepID=UPI0020B2740B|nr:uncharacterized protein ldlrad2 isoform X2 [Brienomyrus brachyistius]
MKSSYIIHLQIVHVWNVGMAKLMKRRSHLSKLFLLMNFMALQVNAIQTVNLVELCDQTIQGDGIIVNSHQDSRKYYFVTVGTDCHLTMQAASDRDRVQFHFRFFLVYSLLRVSAFNQHHLSPTTLLPEASKSISFPGHARPGYHSDLTAMEVNGDPCHAGSYVQFYDGKHKGSPPIGPPLCGKSLPSPVISTGNYLTLRLVTRGTQPRVDFVGDFTSIRLGQELFAQTRESEVTSSPSTNRPLMPPANQSCGTPDTSLEPDSVTDSKTDVLWLILYITLGLLVGTLVMCWCCWSPGWFLWRVSICRFLPCCNSTCASFHLCDSRKEFRLAKVTPQGPTGAATF